MTLSYWYLHLISDNEIEYLSALRGVSLDESIRQLETVNTTISDRLYNSVEAAWQDGFLSRGACLANPSMQ